MEEDSNQVTPQESPQPSTSSFSSDGSEFSPEDQEFHYMELVIACLLYAVMEFLAFLTGILSFSIPFVIVFLLFH